ncbi:MAG: protease-like activity factor CPAF [Deltaproteobacteria bacterium]|nr:protease-like activity factor CPAF [Deltaproteobacteria bacterium]MBI2341227.1 protease-like activity factor CPAF [Deltaproteobacteria bacterium]
MKQIISLAFILFIMFYSIEINSAASRPHQLADEEKLSDFYQLVNQIKNGYGPKEYKKEKLGLDVDVLADEYVQKIKNAKNNGEFYSLIIKFVAEFQDGHFSAWMPTTYIAYLPFSVSLIQDKALIEKVDRKELPKDIFPFDRGDELVSMNDKPVQKIIDELLPYIATGNPRATRTGAANALTLRPGRTFPVPSGDVKVTVKSRDNSRMYAIKLQWKHKGEQFDENILAAVKAIKVLLSSDISETLTSSPTEFSIFDIDMKDSYSCNPHTRIAIPKDATILMEEPFTAYYYPTAKGNVGYVRIPHYYPPDDDKDGQLDFEKWFEHYKWALDRMEKETIGLIIDQDHNCGGSVTYLENIAALFMTGEFEPQHFQFRASKQQVLEFKSWLDEFDSKYYVEYDEIFEIYKLVEDSFYKGLYLTPMTSFHGSRKLEGLGVYTKPVIILIDYFAGSGGDAFPAMMQGLGRAKLLGTTTMGLGGNVIQMPPLFYSQLGTRMTQSLFFRPDGTPVENRGAEPDIPYEITIEDFVNGFADYQKFYTDELLKLID